MKNLTLANTTLAYLAAVLVLGGASAAGFAANAILQLAGAALIGWCLWRPAPAAIREADFPWRALGIALGVLAAVQFLPLPPVLWTLLPGRGPVAEGYRLLGQPLPWLAVSLSPWSSLASLAWWIPALALLVAMRRSDGPHPEFVARVVVGVAVTAIALGAMQRAGAAIYFYKITNYGLGTGFFANANHQANFLLLALALWAGAGAGSNPAAQRADRRQVSLALFYGVAALLVIGVLLSNSVAGVGLLLPTLAGVALIRMPGFAPPRIGVIAGLAVIAAGVFAFAYFGSLEIGQAASSAADQTPGHSRADYLATGLQAISATFPFGSGLGTFEAYYHWFEAPATVGTTYVNHAHDDLLEIVIETGLFGLVPVVIFVAWWVRRSAALWLRHRDNAFALAGSLMLGIVLAHSLVDYPLRTAAISGLAAVAWALMLRPRWARESSRRRERRSAEAESYTLVRI